MPLHMAAIDVLINPSHFKSETFCMVNMEAMSLGIPVVSFGLYGMVRSQLVFCL
jgi:glycosyltransferase involved in cell wall biosynthesis